MVAGPFAAQGGLALNGVNQYVTFGRASNLGSSVFTLETWFNWTGGGVAAHTSKYGLTAIPLIAKLSSEVDGDNRDGNYFLGIRPQDGVLAADLEEGANGASPGANHPVTGTTPLSANSWHHAAVTYDGTNWMLFLDGNLETNRFVRQPPRWDTIQHAALGSSLNSTGTPQGYFAGTLDEVRIWNYARSPAQIAANKNAQIPSATGLLGRWSLEETNGLIAHDTSGSGANGTLVNNPRWMPNVRAAANVVTPIKLTAIDPDRTAAIRQSESKRVPAVFRFDPRVADQMERSLLASLQNTNIASPLGTNTPPTWKDGRPNARVQTELIAKLREVMARYICSDVLSNEANVGPPNVRLYTAGSNKAAPDPDTLQAQSLSCPRTKLWALEKARDDLRHRFPGGEEAVGRYLAGFVKENCIFDAELTRRSRVRHAESFFAADHYEPGQAIVKKGQIIDNRAKAALDELKTQTASDERKAQLVAAKLKAENALKDFEQRAAQSEFKSQVFSQQNRWLLGGLIAVAVTSSIAIWQLARSKRGQTMLPIQRRGDKPLAEPPSNAGDTAGWRERALSAEKRTAQTSAVIRAGLLPHLAQWVKQNLVRRLVAERSHLLSTQEKAELEVAELEARLANVHAPLEQRLQRYRERIDELERELAVRGEENRELIQAKIELTRKRLEAENERVL